jgi:ABC-type amino acid transport substrate-binding protein
LIVAGAVIAAVIVIAGLVARGNIDSSFLAQAETVRVGVRTDIAGFGDIGESGDIEGFDADVAKEVVSRVLTEEKPVAFVPLTSEDAGAGIKYDQIDIAIGFLVPGTARVSGFTITDPYYTDTVYAAVADPAITSLSALDGKTVGILNSMIPLATANDYLDDLDISAEITRYFSLEEAIAGLETGKIDAFLAPGAFLDQYMPSYARIGDPVAQIGYGILLPSSQSLMQGEMNDAIRSMKRDGTLENLAEKWGIPVGG